jgi:hypothetical protein
MTIQILHTFSCSVCKSVQEGAWRCLSRSAAEQRQNDGLPAPSLSQPNFSSTSGGCVRASCAAILLATLAPTQLRRRLIANLALPTLPSLRQLPLRALLLLA